MSFLKLWMDYPEMGCIFPTTLAIRFAMRYSILFFATTAALALHSCDSQASKKELPVTNEGIQPNDLSGTWAGAAEISHYQLKQKRYGKVIDGTAILLYVREPFLPDRQVKDESGKRDFQVLKLNSIREFCTGAYPYHTMTSVFQPLDSNSVGKALKVTSSIQEWCGHTFMQTNRRAGKTHTTVASYFEHEEGDRFTEDASILLEDEIWTALRINPKALPTGKLKIIVGDLAARLHHLKSTAQEATAQWKSGSDNDTIVYEINYTQSSRKLAIEIQKNGSHAIQGWEESDRHGLLSSGTLKKRLSDVAYWNYGTDPEGEKLRGKLDLK